MNKLFYSDFSLCWLFNMNAIKFCNFSVCTYMGDMLYSKIQNYHISNLTMFLDWKALKNENSS